MAKAFADSDGTDWTDKFESMMRVRTVVTREEYAEAMEAEHGGEDMDGGVGEVVEDSQPEYDSPDDDVQESQNPMDLDNDYVDEFPSDPSVTDASDFEMVEEPEVHRGRAPRASKQPTTTTTKTNKIVAGKKANIRYSIQTDPQELMEIEAQHVNNAPAAATAAKCRSTKAAPPAQGTSSGLLVPPVSGRLRSASASSSGGNSRGNSRAPSRAPSRVGSRASSRLRGAETY